MVDEHGYVKRLNLKVVVEILILRFLPIPGSALFSSGSVLLFPASQNKEGKVLVGKNWGKCWFVLFLESRSRSRLFQVKSVSNGKPITYSAADSPCRYSP